MLDIRVPVRALQYVGGRWKATFLHINSSSEKPQWKFEKEIKTSNLAWSRLEGCGGGSTAIVPLCWLKCSPEDVTACKNMHREEKKSQELSVCMILCWRLIKVEALYITPWAAYHIFSRKHTDNNGSVNAAWGPLAFYNTGKFVKKKKRIKNI